MNVPKKKASSKQTRGGQNKHGEINPDETLVLGTTYTYQTSGNDQNNQQEEVSIHENLILGGTSNTHQPTKGFIDLLNGQFSGVNDPNQVMGSWPNMSAPPGSIAGFGYLRHQSMSYDSYHQPSLQGYAPHFPSGYLTQKSREEIYAPFHLPTPRGYNPFFQRF